VVVEAADLAGIIHGVMRRCWARPDGLPARTLTDDT
jgi:hypothetical protein